MSDETRITVTTSRRAGRQAAMAMDYGHADSGVTVTMDHERGVITYHHPGPRRIVAGNFHGNRHERRRRAALARRGQLP